MPSLLFFASSFSNEHNCGYVGERSATVMYSLDWKKWFMVPHLLTVKFLADLLACCNKRLNIIYWKVIFLHAKNVLKGYSTPKWKCCNFSLTFTPTMLRKMRTLFCISRTTRVCCLFSNQRKSTKKTHPCVEADTEDCTHFASREESPKWCYADAEETLWCLVVE